MIKKEMIVLGELEPSLVINLCRALASYKIIALTEIYSSYLYISIFAPDNLKVYFIKENSTGDINIDNNDYIDRVIEYYKSITNYDESKLILKLKNMLINLMTIDLPIHASCLVWNTSTLINAFLVSKYKEHLNVLENGLVRPNFITLDHSGVNIDSEVSIGVWNEKFFKFQPLENYSLIPAKSYIYYRFFDFIFFWTLGSKRIFNDVYFIKRVLGKISKRNKFLLRPFVFLPLQLINDSQCVIYSKYKNHRDVLYDAVRYLEDLCKNKDISYINLIYKNHPLDYEFNNLPSFESKSVFVMKSNLSTDKLVEDCEFVITVNSTVGFEALRSNKRVVLLGRSVYENIYGVVSCTGKEGSILLNEFLNGSQVEFNVRKYNQKMLNNLISYLK